MQTTTTGLFATTALLTAVIGLMASAGIPASEPALRTSPDAGLCRRAPLLAALPPEDGPRRRQPPVADTAPGLAPDGYAGATAAAPVPVAPLPAPPVPSAAIAKPVSESASISVSGSRTHATRGETAAASTDPSSAGPRIGIEGGMPQSGTLTAGEYDDLLNPELYANYVRTSDLGQRIREIPVLQAGGVLAIQVRDAAGRPVPFADVTLTCADGNTLSLASAADGRVVFFPQLDRLGSQVKLDVRRASRALAAQRTIVLAGKGEQRMEVQVRASRAATAVRQFDLMVVLDTTGSMGDELAYLNEELQAIVQRIGQTHRGLDIRVGLMLYRDRGDEYVTRTYPFTRDLEQLQAAIAQQSASGGGDYEEAVHEALHRAVGMDWRSGAVKSLLWVADAPPHDGDVAHAWQAVEAARAKRIHIVPVAASGVGEVAEYLMRASAVLTQSRYLFLTDDSGVGNPHASPAVDCYLVTRLDTLVQRVLESQIGGRRIEPANADVIRRVGNYDHGRCVAPRRD